MMGKPRNAISPTREENYPEWYQQVVKSADLAENTPVRGCMVIKPWGYGVWENIRDALDEMFKSTGHKNAYFPLFIPKSFLQREAEHVDGFAKECAVVTHSRLEADENGILQPAGELEEPLIVRPTSETIIGELFARWVQSYRDLPLLINQWANVVRWEMRPRLFLRTAEFLWQEGHTVHASAEEAIEETRLMLHTYATFAEDWLAMPVLRGEKTEAERFPGAESTLCIEAMMQDRKALQAGTSHFLGQNFSKACGIKFQGIEGKEEFGWTTSWGVSTRLIGGMIMTHSDDTGLVLPPKLAPKQIVIVPIWRKEKEREDVLSFAQNVFSQLKRSFRVTLDDREGLKPGAKYFEWEKKGVPLRMEIGPRDVQKGSVFCAKRTGGKKFGLAVDEQFITHTQVILNSIQEELLERATQMRDEKTYTISSYTELKENVEKGGFFIAPWKQNNDNERAIKEDCKATIRCYPIDMQDNYEGKTCFYSGEPADCIALFAKSY